MTSSFTSPLFVYFSIRFFLSPLIDLLKHTAMFRVPCWLLTAARLSRCHRVWESYLWSGYLLLSGTVLLVSFLIRFIFLSLYSTLRVPAWTWQVFSNAKRLGLPGRYMYIANRIILLHSSYQFFSDICSLPLL